MEKGREENWLPQGRTWTRKHDLDGNERAGRDLTIDDI